MRITLTPSQIQFETTNDERVLDAALRQGIRLPHGCRGGSCGSCIARVVSGSFLVQQEMSAVLSEADTDVGRVLLCGISACSDLVLDCPEVKSDVIGPPVRTMPVRLEQIAWPTAHVAVLTLRLPSGEPFVFLPGQYLDLLLPPQTGGKEPLRRSFSIASSPAAVRERGLLDLHVRLYPGGSFARLLQDSLRPRTLLRFSGPYGKTHLERIERQTIFLAGGTGFAPVKSILEHCFAHGPLACPVSFYWGATTREYLYLHDLPTLWAQERGNFLLPGGDAQLQPVSQAGFRYIPVLSDEPAAVETSVAATQWTGRRGLVHAAMLDDLENTPQALAEHQIYACGPAPMIDAAYRAALARGLDPARFYSDAFMPAAASSPSAV